MSGPYNCENVEPIENNESSPTQQVSGQENNQHTNQQPSQKEYIIQCISVETSYLFCDTIYALEALIKKPLSDPQEHMKAQMHILSNFVKVYYDIVNALQYKGKVINDLTLRQIKFTEVP
jgi:hypothetical protein